MTTGRNLILGKLTEKLFGPGLGERDENDSFEHEIISGRMNLSYMTGILFPQQSSHDALSIEEGSSGDQEDENLTHDPDDPLSMSTELKPSSMGLSFCLIKGSKVKVQINAARYLQFQDKEENDKQSNDKWKRHPLNEEITNLEVSKQVYRQKVFSETATFECQFRKLSNDLTLLTLSLCNDLKDSHTRIEKTENTLFQVSLAISIVTGRIEKYPVSSYSPPTEEEAEIRLIYGKRRPFAVGHGTSVDWKVEGEDCIEITTTPIPKAYVWRPIFDKLEINEQGKTKIFENNNIFNVAYLSSNNLEKNKLINDLNNLINFYEDWIKNQIEIDVEDFYADSKNRIISKCIQSKDRILEGISLLKDDKVFELFKLANKAMLISMEHSKRISNGPFELGASNTDKFDYLDATEFSWRPFQLAFFFQVLPSLINEEHIDRETVDLIWFSTGGGKTEAYLFLAAFELLRRRLFFGKSGEGVAIINRYTFQFLSMDQFQRTSVMICALEILRKEELEKGNNWIGSNRFSIGLFVGGGISPNLFQDRNGNGSNEKLNQLFNEKKPRENNPFPISSCPSCGTYLLPKEQKIKAEDGSVDNSFYGFAGMGNNFRTYCPEESCQFHSSLPIHFVDEDVREQLPSFVLGTIDKFAMLTWNRSNPKLMGADTNFKPPSLIIQDELHLISGPLGTLASLYEASFEVLMKNFNSGKPPKYIASTATIRNASKQIERMYGKKTAIFPSPGITDQDSFFSKLDVGNNNKARLYVGIMGQGLTSTVSVSWSIAAILQSVYELSLQKQLSDEEVDGFWTLLAYHNSKRELGRISNAANDEIPARVKVYSEADDGFRKDLSVLELKSNAATPIPIARQILNTPHSDESKAIDIAPCTNIISVGVDIQRLALMLVNGQPKLSSEYIQASSRVGRGKVSGLIVTCLSPTKPRDRSHYESFKHYHESFYSFVEPTSVTPGSLNAMDRALHACLVNIIRNCSKYKKNEDAKKFDPNDPTTSKLISALRKRIHKSYPDNSDMVNRIDEKLDLLIEEWRTWTTLNSQLYYSLQNRDKKNTVLKRYDEKKSIGWETLQSMRNVDTEIKLV